MKTLVVDDDAMLLETLRDVLEDEGYTVFTAADGEQALRRWDEAHPDIVLLDIMLPGMHGYEVYRRLRERDSRGTTPIIMLTALGAEADELRGLELGADDYVTKPFSPRQLTARMRSVLRRYGDFRVAQERADESGQTPTLVAEAEEGTIYHDVDVDRWIVDLEPKGLTLHFDSAEFEGFLHVLSRAAERYWHLKGGRRRSQRPGALN